MACRASYLMYDTKHGEKNGMSLKIFNSIRIEASIKLCALVPEGYLYPHTS